MSVVRSDRAAPVLAATPTGWPVGPTNSHSGAPNEHQRALSASGEPFALHGRTPLESSVIPKKGAPLVSMMFANAITHPPATNARRESRTHWRWLLALLAASALSLAFAASAAAGVGTGTPITLNSQWWLGNAGFGTIAPTAYLDDYGDVHLWGAAKQRICLNPRGCGGDPNLLGTLPPGPYTPQRNIFTIAHTNFGTYADVGILTNGQIWLIDPRPPAIKDYSLVSLEGISYNPSNGPSTQIQLNNGWAPDTRFNTIAPAAFADDGAVHLEGAAVLTTTPTPPNPTLLGTLPGLGPAGNVYAIAHTNFGTYADVEITGHGGAGPGDAQIWLLAPRFPAFTDYAFVSLEGITYRTDTGFVGSFGNLPVDLFTNWFNTPNGSNENTVAGLNYVSSYEDTAGIVHLHGGIAQTAPRGQGCCEPVAFIQDPAERPSWSVFEIVHTNFGTYADVEIGTDGEIQVIAPRPPAVTDYAFLSLEGLTFAAASPKFFGLAVRGADRHWSDGHGDTSQAAAARARGARSPRAPARQGRGRASGAPPGGTIAARLEPARHRRLLRAGRYQVTLHAVNGNILSVPAPPGPRTLVVLANGGFA
jgi:hypothetical protein